MKKIFIIVFMFVIMVKSQNNIFDFNVDERLFVAYAFMNAAGNDGEWRKDGMNPIRIEIRNIIKNKIDTSFSSKIRRYVYENQLESWVNYGPSALITNGPPEFNINIDYKKSDIDSASVNKTSGLKQYIKEFYHHCEIGKLWNQYKNIIQQENQKYEPFANKALLNITNYCRIKSDYFTLKANNISFQKIPLMSYFTAQTLKVNGKIYIISGPSDSEPSESAFYHEALHHPIGEIIIKYSDLITKYSNINKINKAEIGYKEWIDFFEECLVRTIDTRMTGKLYNKNELEIFKNINSEYELGMLLCPYLNEELKKYENTNISLEEYFPNLLINFDYKKEKERFDKSKNEIVKE